MDRRRSLAVPALPSQTRDKAIDEARRTQAAVVRDCTAAGRDPPPYVLTELIGKGTFGRVFQATSAKTDGVVAVKIISIEEGDAAAADDSGGASDININAPGQTAQTLRAAPTAVVDTFGDVLKEIRTLQLLGTSGARNINTVLDSLLVGPTVWMVTEYCGGGSVATLMRPTGHLPEKWIVPILREVAEALYWVHSQGIIHRDIKCANVLVADLSGSETRGEADTPSRVQLCDFGVAGFVETAVDKRRTVTGTLHWMAPELFRADVQYGTEVDIWAFGSMAYEVATGLPPNATRTLAGAGGGNFDLSTFGSYLEQNCPRLVGNQYSDGLKELVAACMVHDPTQRPPIGQVQQMRYIAGTAVSHPTTSLSALLSAYRLWQARGGGRVSLFSAGGAKGVADSSPTSSLPAWDFGDDEDEDDDDDDDGDAFSLDYEANTLAVYEAYGISLDKSPSLPPTPKPLPPLPQMPPPELPPQSRLRRWPPQLGRALPQVPLQGVFDPNTLTSYRDKARATYGRRPPPALVLDSKRLPPSTGRVSDLPLRSYSNEPGREPDRESLIDLDLSIVAEDTSRTDTTAVDMSDQDTIRPSGRGAGTNRTSLNAMRHRTQDWTFPVASTSPIKGPVQMAGMKSRVERHTTTNEGNQINRVSTDSLIDLYDATGNGSDGEYVDDEAPFEFDTPATLSTLDEKTFDRGDAAPRSLPPVPMVPTSRVLQGVAGRDEARSELLRMLSSLGDHLHLATHTLESLPVRDASRLRQAAPVFQP
ncbi:serine/threonineeeee-protein kinase [Sporothrix schenckii 1099-18]|uniref:non-specific serine/threonine protein kinase n=1 Tax=Sporothrix schenckii 1099-18 TaxID=1397361 RepID=A0A0F2MMB9_SPOSC|nr:serine/threonineeeee-protein kinase [Sporothrix schenckii 1099-18]KJR89331.1 serine/threonineeeee-protein kinase [Sporothrix schenckii 1099-18]